MIYKTSEITGVQLDLAVAIALGASPPFAPGKCRDVVGLVRLPSYEYDEDYLPSSSWAHGGPIIATETIAVQPEQTGDSITMWRAKKHDSHGVFLPGHVGGTPLEAAMRCFVFRKIGAEVDL